MASSFPWSPASPHLPRPAATERPAPFRLSAPLRLGLALALALATAACRCGPGQDPGPPPPDNDVHVELGKLWSVDPWARPPGGAWAPEGHGVLVIGRVDERSEPNPGLYPLVESFWLRDGKRPRPEDFNENRVLVLGAHDVEPGPQDPVFKRGNAFARTTREVDAEFPVDFPWSEVPFPQIDSGTMRFVPVEGDEIHPLGEAVGYIYSYDGPQGRQIEILALSGRMRHERVPGPPGARVRYALAPLTAQESDVSAGGFNPDPREPKPRLFAAWASARLNTSGRPDHRFSTFAVAKTQPPE